jgi:choline dehydrogenase-like flavoprotein
MKASACENVIVGSGAAGSLIAARLVSAGYPVTVIEEGPQPQNNELSGSIAHLTASFYRHGGAIPFLGPFTFPFGEAKVLGGGTFINGGLVWKTPRPVLEAWRIDLPESIFHSPTWSETEDLIRRDLSVHVSADGESGFNECSRLIHRAAQSLGWRSVPVPRALVDCRNLNRCATGCPSGAKKSVLQNYLKKARELGAEVRTNTRALKIEVDREGRGTKLLTQTVEGEYEELGFKRVFLAAGATQSPLLLRRSGLSPRAGKTFEFHLNFKIVARFPQVIDAQRGTIFTHQIQEFEDDGIFLMSSNFQKPYVAMGLSEVSSETFQDYMESIDRLGIYVAMTRPKVSGSIFSFGGQTFGRWQWDSSSLLQAKNALMRLAEILFRAGANDVVLPVRRARPLRSLDEVKQILAQTVSKDLNGVSVHGMSGCRMGIEKELSTTDINGLVWDTKNIYVADSSVLPTNTGESPQGTIMTVAHELVNRWQNSIFV